MILFTCVIQIIRLSLNTNVLKITMIELKLQMKKYK